MTSWLSSEAQQTYSGSQQKGVKSYSAFSLSLPRNLPVSQDTTLRKVPTPIPGKEASVGSLATITLIFAECSRVYDMVLLVLGGLCAWAGVEI